MFGCQVGAGQLLSARPGSSTRGTRTPTFGRADTDSRHAQATDTCDVCLGILGFSCSSPALPLQFFHFRHVEVPLAGKGTHKVDAVLLVDLDSRVGTQLPFLKDSRVRDVPSLPIPTAPHHMDLQHCRLIRFTVDMGAR